jgi:hypothetical protein
MNEHAPLEMARGTGVVCPSDAARGLLSVQRPAGSIAVPANREGSRRSPAAGLFRLARYSA